jgi:hypothetical protein
MGRKIHTIADSHNRDFVSRFILKETNRDFNLFLYFFQLLLPVYLPKCKKPYLIAFGDSRFYILGSLPRHPAYCHPGGYILK